MRVPESVAEEDHVPVADLLINGLLLVTAVVVAVPTLVLMFFFVLGLASPRATGPEFYVRQRVPITLHAGSPVEVALKLSGNGTNTVLLSLPEAAWEKLQRTPGPLVDVEVVGGVKTEVLGIRSAGDTDTSRASTSFSHLGRVIFSLAAYPPGDATLRITFPGAPDEPISAELLLEKTPVDTKALW